MVVRHAEGTFTRTLTDVRIWARAAFNTRTEDKASGQNPSIHGTITSSSSTFPRCYSSGEGVMAKTTQPQLLGRYIVADPNICHGKPTFRGTRILVADVLEQVAAGLAWETIIEEWRGRTTPQGLAASVPLA